jgi:hypothetical protein
MLLSDSFKDILISLTSFMDILDSMRLLYTISFLSHQFLSPIGKWNIDIFLFYKIMKPNSSWIFSNIQKIIQKFKWPWWCTHIRSLHIFFISDEGRKEVLCIWCKHWKEEFFVIRADLETYIIGKNTYYIQLFDSSSCQSVLTFCIPKKQHSNKFYFF